MRYPIFAFAAMTLAVSCQSAEPPASPTSTTSGGGAAGGGGGGAAACVLPPEDVMFPPSFHPQSTCCNDQTCRGSCNSLLTGIGDERELRCVCGLVTFDGKAHHGPPGCADGEECCVMPHGNNFCVPQGQCLDCTPPKSSSKWSVVGCCAAQTACRGSCGEEGMGPCSCEAPGDGGCAEGEECCDHVAADKHECVPFGQCQNDLGPCPPPAASAGVAVDCCDEWPCRGRCEAEAELPGPVCKCGSAYGGCKVDEECCLAPNGKNQDPATQCVPVGTCVTGP